MTDCKQGAFSNRTATLLTAVLVLLFIVIVDAGCSERRDSNSHRNERREPAAAASGVSVPGTISVPATPVGAQFSRWLEAFNSANRETLHAYHEQNFPYSAASADVASIEREHGLSLRTHGFTLKQVEQSTPTALTILVQERARPQFARVHLEVQPTAPYRVAHFEIGPIPTPPQFTSREDLALRRMDAARRQAVVETLSRELEVHYVLADVAQKMAESLIQKASRGDYDKITDAAEFAAVLSEDLRQVSHDKHLQVRFGRMPAPQPQPAAAVSEEPPPWMVAENFGFSPTRSLPGNVVLLTINGFVPLLGAAVEEAIGARISEAADADAVIIDLRSNHGGAPDTVAFVTSYFFEAEAMLLNTIHRRDTGQLRELWTKPELPSRRFGATKPVYVLTSAQTFSGGEDLAYTLQAHKRAIVIGEVTGGGAHPTEPRAIDGGLYVMLPWGRTVNPITNSNWEGTGVRPDFPCASDKALNRALQHLKHRRRPQ